MRQLCIGLLVVFAFVEAAAAQEVGPAAFVVQWERSAPKEEKSGSGGFDVTGVASLPNGSLAVIASDPPERFLFIGADERGIGTEVHLPRDKSSPFQIGSSVNGNLWLSGFANQWMFLPGGTMRDAYLAKYDVNGKFIWEKTYGWWDFRMITEVVPLPSGDLMVAGAHGERSWIAKLDPNGLVLWEHDIGLQKGAVLTPTPDGRFAFTALDRTGENDSHREYLATWIFDAEGNKSEPVVLREDRNKYGQASYDHFATTPSRDGAYVISSSTWSNPLHPLSIEVVKIDSSGVLIWKRQLPKNTYSDGSSYFMCQPSLATLPNGDAIIGCAAASHELLFFRLNAQTGEIREAAAPLPDCQKGRWTADLFLVPRRDGDVWVVGSQKPYDQATGCVWLARLTAPG